jgi:hypothetical protein
VVQVTARDILLIVVIPLLLAEAGPWCGWLAAKLLPLAARLHYGDTERAAIRSEEWSADLEDIPGQLTKLAYAIGQLAAGSAISAGRRTRRSPERARTIGPSSQVGAGTPVGGMPAIRQHTTAMFALNSLPRMEREAITLRYFGHLPEDYIATRMQISAADVRLHTRLGMSKLWSVLEADKGPLATGSTYAPRHRRRYPSRGNGPAPCDPGNPAYPYC